MEGVNLGILSLNVRGLGDKEKRREVFHLFNNKPHQIFMLQETHSTNEVVKIWKSEWGHNIVYSHGDSRSRGVAILIKNDLSHEIHSIKSDNKGRYIILDISIKQVRLTLATIYGPNSDDQDFFNEFIDSIESIPNDNRIVGVDWNVVLDLNMDKEGGQQTTHFKAQKILKDWCDETNLVDIWRKNHEDLKQYTWFQCRPMIRCRLDYFLISFGLAGFVENSCIKCVYKSDHSSVEISINIAHQARGRGFWKFNCSLLQNKDYESLVKKTLNETVEENMGTTPDLLWETIKCRIRGATIQFCSRIKRNKIINLKILEEKVNDMEKNWRKFPTHESEQAMLESKTQLEQFLEKETKAAVVRCGGRWLEYGEKPSKYFLNLEKRNYNMKVINKLVNNNGEIITEANEILKEQYDFYRKLYTSNVTDLEDSEYENIFFKKDVEIPKLNTYDQQSLDQDIQEIELLGCLNTFSNGKAPGSDGFPAEFYKFFWKDIRKWLVASFNYSLKSGKLSITQRQGVISLLPKKGKDETLLKNWRPITLLNTDYKLLAKTIATRFKQIIAKIIHTDQTGFIENRYIGENINKILNIIDYINFNENSADLLIIDFEKAFDCLEWSFILKSLKFFNFGEKICNWIKAIYNCNTSCVINNGYFTEFFSVSRGVRQGCPLSPYLFVICVELLAIAVRNDKNIVGIDIGGECFKIIQYADDTTLTLTGGPTSIRNALSLFEAFKSVSGLRINLDKTEILRIGKDGDSDIYNNLGLKSVQVVKILGVNISNNIMEVTENLYKTQLDKMNNILKLWQMRNITPYGKVVLIKSFAVSQFVYFMSVLPSVDITTFQDIEKALFKFIWDNKPDKIARKQLYGTFQEGGLNMVHLQTQFKALKIAWIKRLLAGNHKVGWRHLVYNSLKIKDKYIFCCNISGEHVTNLFNYKNKFWYDVLYAWSSYNFFYPKDISDVLKQSLWFNSHIKVNKNTLYVAKWYEKGIKFVSDIVTYENAKYRVYNYDELCNTYNSNLDIMTYNTLRSAIPKYWIQMLNNTELEIAVNHLEYNIDKIITLDKVSNIVYRLLIKKEVLPNNKHLIHWSKILSVDSAEVLEAFSFITPSCKCPRTNFFQFKLLHDKVFTNSVLYKMKLVDSLRCSFCELEKETVIHLLWECHVSKNVWLAVQDWMLKKKSVPNDFKFDLKTIILGYSNNVCINNIIMIVKYYIYRNKCLNLIPTGISAIVNIHNYIAKEHAAALYSDKIRKYELKWNKFIT